MLKLRKLLRKDKKKVNIVNKKIKQIVNGDTDSINSFKNLKYELKDFKRVKINKHFVLIFKFVKEENMIFFEDFDHHDNIYKKKRK